MVLEWTLPAFKSFLLASRGEDLRWLGTARTVKNHAEFESKLGVDIRRPLSSVYREKQVVDSSKVFVWKNRFDTSQLEID